MFEDFDKVKDRYKAWHEASFIRRSRRGYKDEDLSAADVQKIRKESEALNALIKNVRIAVVFGKEQTRRAFSMLGGYGTIKNAHAFAAFIVNKNEPDAFEKAGFLGEAFILGLTAQGFSTCWVSGTYNKTNIAKLLSLKPEEEILAATPIGYAAEKKGPMERFTSAYSRGAHRKPIEKICLNFDTMPEWAKKCVECAQRAPSAMNSQPWFFEYADGTLYLREIPQNTVVPYALDLGICMLHVAVTAALQGENRTWKKTASKYHAAFKTRS